MANLGPWEIVIIALAVVMLFGWKKLPDMARSLGRSARVFKSEVNEMRNDGQPADGQASTTTVHGDVVNHDSTPEPKREQPHDQTTTRHDGPAA